MTPFHRLSTPLTRAWAINREVRHKLAGWLAHVYPKTGVAVCTDALFVVAWVNPLAQIKFATPPFQKVERHQCANNPAWRESPNTSHASGSRARQIAVTASSESTPITSIVRRRKAAS